MSRSASKRLDAAEIAAAIAKDSAMWFDLQRLVVDFSAVRSGVELNAQAELLPPVRGLLYHDETAPTRPHNPKDYVSSAVGREAQNYLQSVIRQSPAYQWLISRAGFKEIEEWAGHPMGGKFVPTQGKRAENAIKLLRVITPPIIRWAILRNGKARNLISRVSLTKKDIRLAILKAEELAELLEGVIQTQSRTADRLYSFMDWESMQSRSIRLVNILRDATLEWRQQERSSRRVVREDETTLDRQLIGDLSLSLYDAFERGVGGPTPDEAKSRKIAGSLATILGIDLHRSSIDEAAKLRGKGSV